MKKREASHTPKIEKYFKTMHYYCNWEIKQTTTDSFAYSDVPDHQVNALLAAQDEGYTWKHSDLDPRVKPFDGSTIPPLPGVIVIKYPKAFIIITINNFLYKRDQSKRKSLTYEEAKAIADKIIY